MKTTLQLAAALVAAIACTLPAHAALNYAGTDYDIGGTFFPGGSPPYVVAPWRSDPPVKAFDIDGNNVYGTDGYALFATQFNYPNVGCCGSSVPVDSATYPNIISTPSYVTDTEFLVRNKVGGWNYALIDDPTQTNGARDYNWGLSQTPSVAGQVPYVKLGNIEGDDIYGNVARTGANGAGRWSFTLGNQVPSHIRVSVMSDGYDATQWTATEVLLAKIDNAGSILDIVGSGSLATDRFIDMSTFDIVGGQPGESYAVFAKAASNGQGAIAGVAFDHIPEPSTLGLMCIAAYACPLLRRVR